MGIEIVDHENPLPLRVSGDGTLKVRQEIRLGTGGSNGRGDDLPSRHHEIGHQTTGAMARVVGLHSQDQPRFNTFARRLTLQRLNAALLVDADQVNALGVALSRLPIARTDQAYLLVNSRFILRLGVEPVATTVRFDLRLFEQPTDRGPGNGLDNVAFLELRGQITRTPMRDRSPRR